MRGYTNNYVNDILGGEGFVYEMEHCGFKASLMKAKRLADNGRPHGLPQGSRLPVVPISNLPGCPDEWVREAGVYVCPVDSDWGLWFDWTMNDSMNTAVIPSVKGMNPITGRKLEGPCLESYREKCPVHGTPFGHDLLCEECGYRWPAQNYVTHESTLWWDGFRQPDGRVRQFFFTEEEKRDIASLVIGKENTMPAFGFVFYETREHREMPKYFGSLFTGKIDVNWYCGNSTVVYTSNLDGILPNLELGSGSMTVGDNTGSAHVYCSNTSSAETPDGHSFSNDADDIKIKYFKSMDLGVNGVNGMNLQRKDHPLRKQTKKKSVSKRAAEVSIGAGAEITQELSPDGLGIDGWRDEPSSVIRLYFCFEEQFREIVERGGVRGIQTKREGFLDGLPVG